MTSEGLGTSAITHNMHQNTRYALVTTATGGNYLNKFEALSQPYWEAYCRKFPSIGFVVFADSLDDGPEESLKSGAWQKLLAPDAAMGLFPNIEKVCLADTDVLPGPRARNIFEMSGNKGFAAISQKTGMPYIERDVKVQIAYMRHHKVSSNYPLDSEIFSDLESYLSRRDLPSLKDFFCTGVLVINDRESAQDLRNFYNTVSSKEANQIRETHGTWEEPYLNAYVQKSGKLNWLPYEFQALWNYEMAWFYPYLYEVRGNEWLGHVGEIAATLWRNDFVHFAGGWNESSAWEVAPEVLRRYSQEWASILSYAEIPKQGLPAGKILPSSEDLA